MEHEEAWTRGPVLDGLHPWKISQTVPGRDHMGPMTQLGPLNGHGMSEEVAGEGAYGLPT